jgi:hypothetical protein
LRGVLEKGAALAFVNFACQAATQAADKGPFGLAFSFSLSGFAYRAFRHRYFLSFSASLKIARSSGKGCHESGNRQFRLFGKRPPTRFARLHSLVRFDIVFFRDLFSNSSGLFSRENKIDPDRARGSDPFDYQ